MRPSELQPFADAIAAAIDSRNAVALAEAIERLIEAKIFEAMHPDD